MSQENQNILNLNDAGLSVDPFAVDDEAAQNTEEPISDDAPALETEVGATEPNLASVQTNSAPQPGDITPQENQETTSSLDAHLNTAKKTFSFDLKDTKLAFRKMIEKPASEPLLDKQEFDMFSFIIIGVFTALATSILALAHKFAGKIRETSFLENRMINSIASGMTITFLFLQGIPYLFENRELILETTKNPLLKVPSQLTFIMFLMMLAGLVVMYTLEKVGIERSRNAEKNGTVPYNFHLIILGLTNFGIAYCMPTFLHGGITALLLFTVMMSLYFILEEYTIQRYFPVLAPTSYANIMTICLGLGWLVSLLTLTSVPVLANTLIFSFVIGGVFMVATKTEFSAMFEGRSHYPSFLISVCFQAIVALIIMLFQNIN